MEYLDTNRFYEKFEELDDQLKNEFFKLEVLQEYNEYGIEDWTSVQGDQMRDIIQKAQSTRLKQKSTFDKARERNINYCRVRYLKFPLSKYLVRQFSTYLVSEEIGEQISIFEDIGNNMDGIDIDYLKDFLLFDNRYLLLHKYVGGELEGAYFSDNASEIAPYLEIKKQLSSKAISFSDFLHDYNISVSKIV